MVYRRASSGTWSATAPAVKGRNVALNQISHIPKTSALWVIGQTYPNDYSTSQGALWRLPR